MTLERYIPFINNADCINRFSLVDIHLLLNSWSDIQCSIDFSALISIFLNETISFEMNGTYSAWWGWQGMADLNFNEKLICDKITRKEIKYVNVFS